MERFCIGDVLVSRTDLVHALERIDAMHKEGTYGYLCHMDMRTAYLADHDADYRSIQNHSLMTFPDGMTLVWYARKQGCDDVGKVSGKDFMDAIFSVSVRKGYSHYFYGSTPGTIEKLSGNVRQSYPGVRVLGAVSPPFQPLESFDIDGLAAELNRLRPTFFWCGLGAPKQERLIALLQPKLECTCCAGVGLAFEYFAGTVRRAPVWMQQHGLEWVYRLSQQPGNIRRVIVPFLWMARLLLLPTGKK
ncbi:MAG: WecB/TagA/CpsF family glycosyltransferase [Chlorobiaceae bacterium]|nr:WecB/TagA/CpsF family glycosyltransferase [Chlorobiaceae bacterium]